MGSSNILGDDYQKNTEKEIRKAIGQYYTPDFIIKYILDNTIGTVDVLNNPFISIIDISCGAGYFLMEAYEILKRIFTSKLDGLKKKYKEEIYIIEKQKQIMEVTGVDYWKEENIHYHILKHCIYGADKDGFAVKLTIESLLGKESTNHIEEINIIECDSLVRWEKQYTNEYEGKEQNRLRKFWNKKYDFVVGNPPYIGHKHLDMEYKKWLIEEYKNVFKDKSDLSFCFFDRIIDILSPKGISGIITSRYFMESPTGKQLRCYLKDNANILEIVDFYGADIFKGVGVATAIYFFNQKGFPNKKININKLRDDKYKFHGPINLEDLIKSDVFERFQIKNTALNTERWMLIPQTSMNIYKKIESKAKYKLGDIATSFQGVITGCDGAFVLNSKDLSDYKIEEDILKRWIKNSNVERYYIQDSDLSLIYADLIQSEENHPNSIDFIRNYRDRLENRRECKNGIRKWYQLQWGRDRTLFEQQKIVFPYKATNNRFAIDNNSSYCSADVYSLIIKDEYKNEIPLEFLVGLLNSSIYEFYFKLFGKKMGRGMYDYYPNSVLDLKIITKDIIDDVKHKVEEIMELQLGIKKLRFQDDKINKRIYNLEQEIDRLIGNYFELEEEEYEIMKNTLNIRK